MVACDIIYRMFIKDIPDLTSERFFAIDKFIGGESVYF